MDSPVSNNGRGLKRRTRAFALLANLDSPVSNNGRGLKPPANLDLVVAALGFAR